MSTNLDSSIVAALNGQKEKLVTRFINVFRSQFARMQEDLGPTLKGVYSSAKWVRIFNANIRPFVFQASRSGVIIPGAVFEINEERLAAGAVEYADATVTECIAKLQEKLGELENARVVRFDGYTFFELAGTRAGRSVRIEQNMIINVSVNGVLFNQFPARLYVDGKFTSAAAFKKM